MYWRHAGGGWRCGWTLNVSVFLWTVQRWPVREVQCAVTRPADVWPLRRSATAWRTAPITGTKQVAVSSVRPTRKLTVVLFSENISSSITLKQQQQQQQPWLSTAGLSSERIRVRVNGGVRRASGQNWSRVHRKTPTLPRVTRERSHGVKGPYVSNGHRRPQRGHIYMTSHSQMLQNFSLSVSTAIFPGGPGLTGNKMSLFRILLELRMMEVVRWQLEL